MSAITTNAGKVTVEMLNNRLLAFYDKHVFRYCILPVGIQLILFICSPIYAETERVPSGVGVQEKLGQSIPTALVFQDESGQMIDLQKYFDRRRPIILVPSYYTCERLCRFVFRGLRQAVEQAAANGLQLGRDYRIIAVSIDEHSTPRLARARGNAVRTAFQQQTVKATDWQFLSGNRNSIAQLMRSIGYSYHRDPKLDASSAKSQYDDISHAAAIVLLSPQAKIMRYLYGVSFNARDFRLALLEAANGQIGDTVDRILLYCFRYDALAGKYTPFAWAFMRIGAVLTLVFLLGLWFILKKNKTH